MYTEAKGSVDDGAVEAAGGACGVADDGGGFDPAAGRSEDALSEGGLGIAIIRAVADELEIGARPSGEGSRLRFVKRLGAR